MTATKNHASPAGLKIIGPYTNDNLSSSADAITLFDSSSTLVDRLYYPGTPAGGAAAGITRNPGSASALGLDLPAHCHGASRSLGRWLDARVLVTHNCRGCDTRGVGKPQK